MNLNLATLPLPPIASAARSTRRRRRISGLPVSHAALSRFQKAAISLQPASPMPDLDAIASAARRLNFQFAGLHRAPCIRLRQRCLRALRAMASDANWQLEPEKRRWITLIVDYAANPDRLVPEDVPVVGGLDQAVLVDLAWPSLQFDLDDYRDFRRLRAAEAALRGLRPNQVCFDREDWLQARFAELAWHAHVRRRGRASYLGGPAPALFALH
ncbi:MAG: hypothetical protein M3485_05015 [Pseudomonadota bacterium]|nr:hypothetical protein [Pseudomonadota bacterium]